MVSTRPLCTGRRRRLWYNRVTRVTFCSNYLSVLTTFWAFSESIWLLSGQKVEKLAIWREPSLNHLILLAWYSSSTRKFKRNRKNYSAKLRTKILFKIFKCCRGTDLRRSLKWLWCQLLIFLKLFSVFKKIAKIFSSTLGVIP